MRHVLILTLLMVLVPGPAPAGETFACNLRALTPRERARHEELSRILLGAVREQQELPNGYAFRVDPGQLVTAARWVSFERRCCPFFSFALEQTRDEGPLWVKVTGPAGVKPFIRAEFGI